MRIPVLAALLTLTAGAPAAPGQQPGKAAGPEVSVDLSFSVAEYDPRKPGNATVKCVVHNRTEEAVDVPVGYDGRAVTLTGGLLKLYPNAKLGKKTVKLIRVAPGKDQIVFELPLAEVLKGEQKRDSAWFWSWERRPMPPPSPIHAHRKPGYAERASFVARVEVGGRVIASGPVVLKVKASE